MLGLDVALGDLAAIVLLGCLGWAWLALTVTVAEALGGSRGCDVRRGRAPWRLPPSVRRLVLAACGVALTTAAAPPAIAGGDSGRPPLPGAAVLRGLPLPDRAVAPPRTAAASRTSSALGRHWVVVRAGDCLWSIAARELAPDAPPSAVVSRWHALYAVNRGRIGPDPDVLEPGQRLLLPGRDPS